MATQIRKTSLMGIMVALALAWILSIPCAAGDSQAVKKPAIDPAYRIGAGDLLQIITWREPNFTLETLVRLDGKITFPLLDDIPAAGLTPLELKKNLQESLRRFIEEPAVTVMVKMANSQKFYILGEVQKTGEYPLTKGLTVLQAFALAGGFTEWASEKRIVVMRRIDGEEKIFNVNYKNIVKGKDLSQNILIQADDTIVVP